VAAEVNTFDFWPSQARPGLSVPAFKSSIAFYFGWPGTKKLNHDFRQTKNVSFAERLFKKA
jgi:hypothetical protein